MSKTQGSTWTAVEGIHVSVSRKRNAPWTVNVGGISVFTSTSRSVAGRVFAGIVVLLRRALSGDSSARGL